jgi:hypothetical protein
MRYSLKRLYKINVRGHQGVIDEIACLTNFPRGLSGGGGDYQ